MNRAICTVSLVSLGLLLASLSSAGPFGLEMGMSLEEIGGDPKEIAPGKYEIIAVPRPHSAFESYMVQVAPKAGLCFIKAIGKDISTSVYGTDLELAFNKMRQKLEANYGKHKTLDFLREGSIWNEPRDWMMALKKDERVLVSIWDRDYGSSLPDDLTFIDVKAYALGTEMGFLSVEYYFVNEKAGEAEISAPEDDAL